MKPEYKLVRSYDIGTLEHLVNELIDSEWEPYKSLVASPADGATIYIQPMTRWGYKDEEYN